MKTFREFLDEGISDIVFHYTTGRKALSIIKKNKFILTPSYGISSESPRGLFFLSLTRSRATGRYHVGSHSGVIFVLDGRKLSHRFSGEAIDYWSGPGLDLSQRGQGQSEAEDRLFAQKPTIHNAKKYIIRADILAEPGSTDSFATTRNSTAFEIYRELKKKHIPVSVYDDRKKWAIGRGGEASFEDIVSMRHTPEDDPEMDQLRRTRAVYDFKRDPRGLGLDGPEMAIIKEFLLTGDVRDPKDRRRMYDLTRFDGASIIGAAMHNVSRNQGTKAHRVLSDVVMLMKKLGLKNARELHKYMLDNWKG